MTFQTQRHPHEAGSGRLTSFLLNRVRESDAGTMMVQPSMPICGPSCRTFPRKDHPGRLVICQTPSLTSHRNASPSMPSASAVTRTKWIRTGYRLNCP